MIKLKSKIEYSVNSLLKNAYPNTYHEFRLYKLVQSYYGYNENLFRFRDDLKKLYKNPLPKDIPNINKMLKIKISDYDSRSFIVGFHNSSAEPLSILQAATSLEWIFKNDIKVPVEIANTGIFLSILNSLFKPSSIETFHISGTDFIDYWKQLSFLKFGDRYENMFVYLESLVEEIDCGVAEDIQLQNKIQLTQTQIDWVQRIKKSLEENKLLPKYPLSSQITLSQLNNINQHVRVYNHLFHFKHPSVLLKTEKVVKSLNLLCSKVLNEKTPEDGKSAQN